LTLTLGTEVLEFQPLADGEELTWLSAKPFYLPAGDVPIMIEASGPAVLDALTVSHDSALEPPGIFLAEGSAPAVLEYEQIDSTRYQVYVQAQRPFTLALAETYDPLWSASGPDFQISSSPLYGVINGFEISRTGAYQILVEYQAQQGARLGALLSGIVFLSLGPSIWLLQRRKSDKKPVDDGPGDRQSQTPDIAG
jgi:hypothetical protein